MRGGSRVWVSRSGLGSGLYLGPGLGPVKYILDPDPTRPESDGSQKIRPRPLKRGGFGAGPTGS